MSYVKSPETHLTDTILADYDVPDEVRWGLAEAGFVFATPIQEKTLPIALAGRDVAGQAQTGTGKTAAFLITIFSALLRRPRKGPARGPRALVVAPTRELVAQIRDDAELLGRHTGLSTLAVFGGIDYRLQREAVKKVPDLLVGTPGPPARLRAAGGDDASPTWRSWSSTRRTGCSTWASSGTCGGSSAAALRTIAGRPCSFPPPSPTG